MLSWWHKFVNWLLWVDVPGNAALSGVDRPEVRDGLALSLTIVFVAVSAAVILGMYFFESRRLGIIRRLFLAGVRTAVVAVLFFLLFRPLLVIAVFKGERPRGVALMLDNTKSMKQADRRISAADKMRVALAKNKIPLNTNLTDPVTLPSDLSDRPSRLELIQDVLVHPELNLLTKLQELGPMRIFVFGEHIDRVVDEPGPDGLGKALTKALQGDEMRTALADGINEVLLRGDGDLPAAIVLMTDGGDNASKTSLLEVARECKRLGIPLHIYGVGSTEAGMLQLRDVNSPEVLFAEDPVAVSVRWKAAGMKGGTVEIITKLRRIVPDKVIPDEVVARKEIPAIDGDDRREVLTFKPSKEMLKSNNPKERLELVTTIGLKGSTEEPEEIKRPTRFIDQKIKLLYVENSPRWVYQFLQMNLLRDVRVEPSYYLINGDEKALSAGPPYLAAFPATKKELFNYDLLILGDVDVKDAKVFGDERLKWIADFVKEGHGLIHFAGRQHSPASWHGTVLESLLPIEFDEVRFNSSGEVRSKEFQPALTLVGERHELLSMADTHEENLRIWRDLPPLYWYYPVRALRPGAYSLLVHPTEKCTKNKDEPLPLISMQYVGKGLVICLTIEEMWRWRYNSQDQYFTRFWGQAIYQAGLPHSLGTKQTQLTLDRSEIVMGQQLQVFARLFDANFQPVIQNSVFAKLEPSDGPASDNRGQTIELKPTGQPGEYTVFLPNDRVGRYTLKTQGPAGDTATLDYRVMLPPHHEDEKLGLLQGALEEAAKASGGAFYREENLSDLVKNIKPQSAPFTVRQPLTPLNPLMFLLFVFLITVEWVVRKFSNLS